MELYWNSIWNNEDSDNYKKYIDLNREYIFIDFFKKYGIKSICDVACGFGKYSVVCGKNGFDVYGFDISRSSVKITEDMLNEYKINYNEYKVCSIADIKFNSNVFDGVVAHAVIDHLYYEDALKARDELFRIVRQKGLVYLSFDRLDKEDMEYPHVILSDGTMKYTKGERKGMVFKYYKDEEIKDMFKDYEVLYFGTDDKGSRDIIVRKG
ncbi:class I SAM-dependent methyltransferase [Dethiothermospora halolimnae]|uniref:class I SAM-dependent methyltransferase n=1 Tax=Dethiothermospora halolimnae TaxID=3114390 RepID=UPI003CCB8A18